MSPSDLDLLRHIQEETIFVLTNTSNKKLENILNDAVLSRAIIRSIEVIGEASGKISNDFKAVHKEIEWKKIIATRHKLIHEYFGIDYEIVWDIIENKLPQLHNAVMKILNPDNA